MQQVQGGQHTGPRTSPATKPEEADGPKVACHEAIGVTPYRAQIRAMLATCLTIGGGLLQRSRPDTLWFRDSRKGPMDGAYASIEAHDALCHSAKTSRGYFPAPDQGSAWRIASGITFGLFLPDAKICRRHSDRFPARLRSGSVRRVCGRLRQLSEVHRRWRH